MLTNQFFEKIISELTWKMRGKISILHTVLRLLETLVYPRYMPRIPHLLNLSHSWNQDSLSPGRAGMNSKQKRYSKCVIFINSKESRSYGLDIISATKHAYCK